MAIRGIDGYNLRLYAMPRTIHTRITANSKKAESLYLLGFTYVQLGRKTRLGQKDAALRIQRRQTTIDPKIAEDLLDEINKPK